jgi:uroporphyrinogen decarboxylase
MNILHYKNADRMPAIHFGYWKQLLDEWAEQGHITKELADTAVRDGSAADRELDKIIGWDCGWNSIVGVKNHLFPAFEPKVLEVLPDGSQRVITKKGVIERIKPGVVSIPSEDDYLLKDREAFETLFKPKMQFSVNRVDKTAVINRFNELHACDIPVGINVGSVMGEIRDITTVMGMSYLMYDEDEDLFADIVDTYAEMQYQCVEEVLNLGLPFDYAHYWEDICFKSGPLLSPQIFDELCAKHYKKRNELCHKHGIDIISLDCDGVVGDLIPTWLDNGVNVLFPIEVGVWGDQFEAARKKHGQRLLGVGGMDKTAFRKDRAAVDAEIARMERLASLGGFIPCPDHRLMPGSKFELVQYYAEKIKEIRF